MNLRRIKNSFLHISPSCNSKKSFLVFIILLLLLPLYFLGSSAPVTEITQKYSSPSFDDLMEYLKVRRIDETPVSPLELITDYELSIQKKLDESWDFFFKQYRYKHFLDLDLNTKCKFYFQNLYSMNPKWNNDFHNFAFDIVEESNEDMLKGMEKDKDGVTLLDEESLRHFRRTHDIGLAMERYRLYDACFIQERDISVEMNDLFVDSAKESVISHDEELPGSASHQTSQLDSNLNMHFHNNQWEFEHKMNPMIPYFDGTNFTSIMPIFTKSDGQQLEQGNFPNYRHSINAEPVSQTYVYDPQLSFWSNWNAISSLSSQRGIVISAGDRQVDFTIKLLATLRYQRNSLPIQVVHFDQLSEESIRRLTYAAESSDFSDAPRQEIWYVNVKPIIDESVKSNFGGFKNKWLSILFNTFEEFIFVDADAVSYINLEDYFNFPEYISTGALFFKDRALNNGVHNRCPALIETLQPKVLEQIYFNIHSMISPEYVENQCMNNLNSEEKAYKDFFENFYNHQLDSGLLVLNKKKHIMGLLISAILNISPKVGGCSYGDKEFFWLGLLVAGHLYSIYDVDASAIGKSKQTHSIQKGDAYDQYEINSSQLAHTSYDHKLLWVNSGTVYCKHPQLFEDDWDKHDLFREDFGNDKELASRVYSDIVEFDRAIIPDHRSSDWFRSDGRCDGHFRVARYTVKPKPYSYNKKITKGEMFGFGKEELENARAIDKIWRDAVVE